MANMIKAVCRVCGVEFEMPYSERNRQKTCSTKCGYAWMRRYRINKPCATCGKVMELTPAVARRQKFCSLACTKPDHTEQKLGTLAKRVSFTCPICGKTELISGTQYNLKRKRVCSKKCWDEQRNVGRRRVLTCETCGREVSVLPGKSKTQRYCSRECAKVRHEREANPNWRADRHWKCQQCGKEEVVAAGRTYLLDRKYCSRECSAKSVIARRGIISAPIGSRQWWDGKSEWMIKRDDGKWIEEYRWVAEQKIGRRLRRGETVHHINGDHSDNSPENLQIVTNSQHRKIHREAEIIGLRIMSGEFRVIRVDTRKEYAIADSASAARSVAPGSGGGSVLCADVVRRDDRALYLRKS